MGFGPSRHDYTANEDLPSKFDEISKHGRLTYSWKFPQESETQKHIHILRQADGKHVLSTQV